MADEYDGNMEGSERVGKIIPEKCIDCIHHKITENKTDYCDYVEYYKDGIPVPYPWFFKQEYPCKGYKEGQGGG